MNWQPPTLTGPLDASIDVPGSKSLTTRYLVVAALADGPSTLHSPLISQDTSIMVDALSALGTRIDATDESWTVTPSPHLQSASIECGVAGTAMRFLPSIAGLADGPVELCADPKSSHRPIAPLLTALRDLGVDVHDTNDWFPLQINGQGHIRGGHVELDASQSSQFISSLLLAGARFDEGLVIDSIGDDPPSTPHIDMTIDVLREAGVAIDDGERHWAITPSPISPVNVVIEPDLSNAAPFIAAAMITRGCIRIPRWPMHTTQAGDHMRNFADMMGADVHLDNDGLSVTGGELHGIDVDLHDVGELTPTIAALAALADSPSLLRRITHLRGHETDRLTALREEINALGGRVSETDDGLRIDPAPLSPGMVHTRGDHRLATMGAILSLAVPGIAIDNADVTAKTMPQFTDLWSTMLTDSKRTS